jgi:hypothetical protein
MGGVKQQITVRIIALLGTSLACNFLFVNSAIAQTTPTELVDLSLEDLLNVEIFSKDKDAKKSKWDFNYSFSKGDFGEYKIGTTDVSFEDVLFSPGETRTLQNYPVVPTFICQNVNAFSASYAFTDDTSLNVLVPYISQSTDHISSVPGFNEFRLTTKGVGDIAVNVAHSKKLTTKSRLQVSAGLRIPIGSIDKVGDTPRNGTGTNERLPYTMQLGSRTLDLSGSAAYSWQARNVNLSAGANTIIRTGINDNGYRIGNSISGSLSSRYTKNPVFQPGLKLTYRDIQKIHGGDAALLVPGPFSFPAGITDPSNYGGKSLNTVFTVKGCIDDSCSMSFNAEYGVPIYQNLNGVQPKVRRTLSLGATLKL